MREQNALLTIDDERVFAIYEAPSTLGSVDRAPGYQPARTQSDEVYFFSASAEPSPAKSSNDNECASLFEPEKRYETQDIQIQDQA